MIFYQLSLIFPIVGVLLIVESLAIKGTILWVKKWKVNWSTRRNLNYLYSDGFVGFILMLHYFFGQEIWYLFVIAAFTVLSMFTHFLRISEYLLKKENAFCANRVLYFMNNLKLVLLFGLLFALLPF
ncbi:MAG: hypothetical protein ACERKD_24335 [Prolixibacteraceae bacterium]